MKKVFILLTTIVLVSSCSTFKSETKNEIARSESKITRNIASCNHIFSPGRFKDFVNYLVYKYSPEYRGKSAKPWYSTNPRSSMDFQLSVFQDDKIILRGQNDFIYQYVGDGKYVDQYEPNKSWFQFDCPILSKLREDYRATFVFFLDGKYYDMIAPNGLYGYQDTLARFFNDEAYEAVTESKRTKEEHDIAIKLRFDQ